MGLVVLTIGLSALGWVAYQVFGTNLVAEHAFSSQKDQLRRQWQHQPAPVRSPSAAISTAPGQAEATPKGRATGRRTGATTAAVPGEAIGLLRIPRFGSGFEVPILDGTDLDTLARGVGHYRDTSMPGQLGNFALAGHRITHGQPFARLLELERGDQVVVETRTAIYTYVIDEPPRSLTVKANASWVLDPVPGKPTASPDQALITLTTCQDLFHSPDRSIGFGHLASTTNKG